MVYIISDLRFVIGGIFDIFNSISTKKYNPPPILPTIQPKENCPNWLVTFLNVLSPVTKKTTKQIVGRPNQDLCIIKGENLCVTGPNETMCNFHP